MNQNKLLSKPVSYLMFGFIGALFGFCFLTGRDLAQRGNILWTQEYLIRTLGFSFILGGTFGSVICFGFRKAVMGVAVAKLGSSDKGRAWVWLCGRDVGRKGQGKVFWLSFGLIYLAWFPAFLAYYPAICAYDAVYQTGQIVENYYIAHHPICHTLLIKWAMMLGEHIFGSVNTGIGCYTLLQMALLASALAFGMSALGRRGVRHIWLVLAQGFCMWYPFHLYMSVSMTKDTIFSAFFLFQLVSLCEIMDGWKKDALSGQAGRKQKDTPMEWVFFFSTVGMILFRNNGKYAFLFFLAVLVLIFLFGRERRRFWGRLLLRGILALAVGILVLWAVQRATDAGQGDRREMLSIPIQQLARTMVYHGGVGVLAEDDDTMGETDKALVDDFILNEGYKKYRPDFADPVKSNTNTYVVRYRTGEFIATYFRLFRQYPGDFLNAVLAVDAGYLYLNDVSHAYVNAQEGQAPGGGYVQTRWEEDTLNSRGIFKDSKWHGLFETMEKWADENAYLKVPVLKYLFMPGTVIWLYLLLLGWRLLRREFGKCMPLVLVFGYFLTLLLGPTVQLRYLYPIIIAYPFMLLGRGLKSDYEG